MLRRRGRQKLNTKLAWSLRRKMSPVLQVRSERKQSEPSGKTNNINVNISLGNDFRGLSAAVNASDGESPAKKAKTGPSKPAFKKTEGVGPSKPSKKTTESRIEQPFSQKQQVPKRPIQTARFSKAHRGLAERSKHRSRTRRIFHDTIESIQSSRTRPAAPI